MRGSSSSNAPFTEPDGPAGMAETRCYTAESGMIADGRDAMEKSEVESSGSRDFVISEPGLPVYDMLRLSDDIRSIVQVSGVVPAYMRPWECNLSDHPAWEARIKLHRGQSDHPSLIALGSSSDHPIISPAPPHQSP